MPKALGFSPGARKAPGSMVFTGTMARRELTCSWMVFAGARRRTAAFDLNCPHDGNAPSLPSLRQIMMLTLFALSETVLIVGVVIAVGIVDRTVQRHEDSA